MPQDVTMPSIRARAVAVMVVVVSLAGCLHGEQGSIDELRSFTAAYQNDAGGTVEIGLDEPQLIRRADGSSMQAYPFWIQYGDASEDRETYWLDFSWRIVRQDLHCWDSVTGDDDPCNARWLMYSAKGGLPPIPLRLRDNLHDGMLHLNVGALEVNVTVAMHQGSDGTIKFEIGPAPIDLHNLAAYVPSGSVTQASHMTPALLDTSGFRGSLVEAAYVEADLLPKLAPSEPLSEAAHAATTDWSMFPDEGQDLFALGVSPAEVLSHLRTESTEADQVWRDGCFQLFLADWNSSSKSGVALGRQQAEYAIRLVDANQRLHTWTVVQREGILGTELKVTDHIEERASVACNALQDANVANLGVKALMERIDALSLTWQGPHRFHYAVSPTTFNYRPVESGWGVYSVEGRPQDADGRPEITGYRSDRVVADAATGHWIQIEIDPSGLAAFDSS